MYEEIFGYNKHSNVTDLLFVLRLPSFNTVIVAVRPVSIRKGV